MGRFFILGALLLLAVVFYLMGSTYGAVAFMVVGVLAELAFWFTFMAKTRKAKTVERS